MTTTLIDRLAGISEGLAVKAPVLCATTANITLSGLQTIDGIVLVADDRVLVCNQTDTTENGIYDAAVSTWTRSKDFDGSRDIVRGTRVYVISGSIYATSEFIVTSTDPITIGTSNITFSSLSNALWVAFFNGRSRTVTAAGTVTISATTDDIVKVAKTSPAATNVVFPSVAARIAAGGGWIGLKNSHANPSLYPLQPVLSGADTMDDTASPLPQDTNRIRWYKPIAATNDWEIQNG